jgi:CheY-like chemotaxis protein
MALIEEAQRYAIAIADDDPASREGLQEIVSREGFRTYLASCGEEALEIVRAGPIHLLVCDMYMPRMTGLEILELVRQINEVLPCILVTAEIDQRLIRQALTARAFSVLSKPVNKNILLYTVVRALAKAYPG